MPLNKLDNFIKNTEGRILYVSPSDLDSTDSISNEGNSLARPFKTIQRALIEASRFSYVKGNANDIIEKTTILVMPGEHIIDNRPGLAIYADGTTARVREVNSSGTGTVATETLNLTLNTTFDLTQEDNVLYKFNSVHGGVVVPRGTSLVGLDLRKTKIRPKYVPDPTDSNVDFSAIFRVTGSCYFWQFSIFDGDEDQLVYTNPSNFGEEKRAAPTFSHNKLTVFEYCDGINNVDNYDSTDLDMYYYKVGNAYNVGSTREIEDSQKYPLNLLAFEPQRPEYEIVGAFGTDPIKIDFIQAGNNFGVTSVVTVRTNVPHKLQLGTPIKIRGVNPTAYNISAIVSSPPASATEFTYTLPNPDPALTAGNVTAATVTVETDTVEGASPYIFNCSMRSVYGMNGMKADGDKATGFRSMVVAQFTGISLQKDDRAFVKYDKGDRVYNPAGAESPATTMGELSGGSSKTAVGEAYHLDSEAVYRPGWETTHIKIVNDAILQIVSVFAIGYAKHFEAQSGGDASITNSNSNFGQLALVADGFKDEAFAKDNKAWVTSVIPPRSIETTEETIDWAALDTSKTADDTKIYLYGFTSQDIKPPVNTQGYRIGARLDDKLYMDVAGTTFEAKILMPTYDTSSFIEYPVSNSGVPSSTSNSFTIGSNDLTTGEKVIVRSETGDLPENIEVDIVYYVIDNGDNDSIKLGISEADALNGTPITVSGGQSLRILSRVSDKVAGDAGHPVQWDGSQWYITVLNAGNTITPQLIVLNSGGTSSTEFSYIKRREDSRSLDEKLYKLRVVIPKELGNAKNPESGFVIQESSTTGARSDDDFTQTIQLTSNDYEYDRNPGFISTCTSSGTSSSDPATVITELPHKLNVGDTVIIRNVSDSVNTTGAANTGYNGSYPVLSIVDDMTFTYQPSKNHGTVDTNDTSTRTVASLPRFERNDLQKNLYIYRNEIISEYLDGDQDGIYHLYALGADYAVPSEFTGLEYSQNVTDLYPQLDRDNVDDNPFSADSYAVRKPLGKVVTNDLKRSITRESTDIVTKTLGIGITITTISDSGTSATLTLSGRHGISGIVTGSINSAGTNYTDGTYYNVKLFNESSCINWWGATATVGITGNAVTSVSITSPGCGYTVTGTARDLFFDTSVVGGDANATWRITSGDTQLGAGTTHSLDLQITGIGTTASGHYKLQNVLNQTQIAIAKTAGDPLILPGQYILPVSTSIVVSGIQTSTSGIATFNCASGHGLFAGNSFTLKDTDSNNNLGEFIVKSRVDADSFTIGIATDVDITDRITTTSYVLKHGYAANEKVSDRTDENLAVRCVSIFNDEIAKLKSSLLAVAGADTVEVELYESQNGIIERFPYGSYIQIGDEIMRVALGTLSGSASNKLTVIRGALATNVSAHDANSLIRKIKPLPIEFRRPSILRASGHTFEYLGYGPGNYSTALPQVQDITLTEREEFLCQSQEKAGGVVVYTGMNNKGDFFIGNQKKSSATGEEITFDTPIPTVTGEAPSRLSVVYDEVTIKDRLTVEGGDGNNILSQFDGPVTFNKEVKFNGTVNLGGGLKIRDTQQSNSTTSGALVVNGGTGIAKNLHVGGTLTGVGATFSGDLFAANITASGTVKATNFIGNISGASGLPVPGGNIGTTFYDNIKCSFGSDAGPNLEIFHDATDSIITSDTGAGSLNLRSDTAISLTEVNGTTKYAQFTSSGAAELYHNGNLRLETTDTSGSSPKDFNGVYITGQLKVEDDITAFATSDRRLKDNISPIKNALDKVKSISGNTFDWNEASNKEGSEVGVIAQEIDALGLPGITTIREDGTYAVRYEKLVPILIEAIKELSAKVDALS